MSKLKTYKIPVSWTVTATVEVEAGSLNEAIAMSGEVSLPTDSEYLDDSFRIDVESLDCVNTDKSILKEIKNHQNL